MSRLYVCFGFRALKPLMYLWLNGDGVSDAASTSTQTHRGNFAKKDEADVTAAARLNAL